MSAKLVNVRGANGSGKTTLFRKYAEEQGCVVVPKEIQGHRPIPVTYLRNGVAIIGDYSPAAAGCTTAGLDRIHTQQNAKDIIELVASEPEVKVVLFEGIMVSTIYGPWLEFSKKHGGTMSWVFLDTPFDVCLKRVYARNGGKPVKEDQIKSKWDGMWRIQAKAREAGQHTAVLPYELPVHFLSQYLKPWVDSNANV